MKGTDEVVVYGWGISGERYTLGANVENLSLQYVSSPFGDPLPVDGIGNELANGITGNDAANVLSGLAGNDTLFGLGGSTPSMGVPDRYRALQRGGGELPLRRERCAGYGHGPDGTDTLTNIEQLNFANLSFSIADRSHFDPLTYLSQSPMWARPQSTRSRITGTRAGPRGVIRIWARTWPPSMDSSTSLPTAI